MLPEINKFCMVFNYGVFSATNLCIFFSISTIIFVLNPPDTVLDSSPMMFGQAKLISEFIRTTENLAMSSAE